MTVALAEFLSFEFDKRVLLIDLDPQTNATVSLIDEEKWLRRDEEGRTLKQLFKDKLERTSLFDIERAIVHKVSNISGGIEKLDLLPSSLGLIELQDSLPMIPAGNFYVTSPVTVLKEALQEKINEYDIVLIDCPPNLGIITLNGIFISDYYIIPTIPDILSTYGIPQILGRINAFKNETRIRVVPLGIIISMFRAQSRLHATTVDILKTRATYPETDRLWVPHIFETKIPLTVRVSEAADESNVVNTLKQKYGYGVVYENYKALTRELLNHV